MWLKPSDIYFSQDSINNRFDKNCPHSYKTVGGTLDDLCEGRTTVNEIPMISVMFKRGKWFTGDNRRLWVFRQLERLGKCTEIPVWETSYIRGDKFTSLNGGVSVSVRRDPGGIWYRKPSQRVAYTRNDEQERRSPPPSDILSIVRRRMESQPRSGYGNFSNLNITPSTFQRPASSSIGAVQVPIIQPTSPASVFGIHQRETTSDEQNVKYVDPMDCRFLKDSVSRQFDNGHYYDILKRGLVTGLVSYRDVPAVEVYEAYDSFYVYDGNRRLKAFQEASGEVSDIKIKVEVKGDEDDLLDELRKDDPAISAFEVMQLGETIAIH